jgi:uncharacterized membrane protein YbhN (UPF0104 family)
VLVVVHASDERELVHLARRAQPWWLLLGLALQAATYPFQSEVWQTVLRPAGARVGAAEMGRLTLARLAVDHTLPAAGLGGTVLAAKALEQQHVSLPVIMAGVVIDTASLFVTYAFGLAAALVIFIARYEAPPVIVIGAIAFLVFALALAIGSLGVAGHPAGPFAHRLARLRPLGVGLRMIEQADRRLSHSPLLLARASICQAAVVLLDVATMWALIAALGTRAAPAGVFASFMMSTLLRLAGALPGGLGTVRADPAPHGRPAAGRAVGDSAVPRLRVLVAARAGLVVRAALCRHYEKGRRGVVRRNTVVALSEGENPSVRSSRQP